MYCYIIATLSQPASHCACGIWKHRFHSGEKLDHPNNRPTKLSLVQPEEEEQRSAERDRESERFNGRDMRYMYKYWSRLLLSLFSCFVILHAILNWLLPIQLLLLYLMLLDHRHLNYYYYCMQYTTTTMPNFHSSNLNIREYTMANRFPVILSEITLSRMALLCDAMLMLMCLYLSEEEEEEE